MVSQWLHDDQRLEGIIYTPYFLAKQLKLSPGSVTAACKALVRDGVIKQHGASPFMVGRK